MSFFSYQDKILHAEKVNLQKIADSVSTPFYIYSRSALESNVANFFQEMKSGLKSLDFTVCYAVKACPSLAILRVIANMGCGADIVSGGELYRCKLAGMDPKKIVFSGVGKTYDEIVAAITLGIGQFNVESIEEIDFISSIALKMGKVVPISLRLNPNVDSESHHKISTGKAEDKFGIPADHYVTSYRDALLKPGISVNGISIHIGSQITDIGPFSKAFAIAADVVKVLKANGFPVNRIDLGGGLGVCYTPGSANVSVASYSKVVHDNFSDLECSLIFEPGRCIVADTAILVSKVLYRKPGHGGRDFLILDAAMNDFMRPAMYSSVHELIPVAVDQNRSSKRYNIAGSICESGDSFMVDCPLQCSKKGDMIVFKMVGAYGSSMASEYNSRPLVPEVMVFGEKFYVIRRRPSFDEMVSKEFIPHL